MENCAARCIFSENDIVRICADASGSAIIGGAPYGNKVAKLSDEVVVKFGVGVTADEARNQAKVYEMTDRSVVRIPKVHHFFQDSYNRGYIVMELLRGEVEDPLVNEVHLQAVSGIVKYFATISADRPGPPGGGKSRALLFGEADEPTFTTAQDMEEWFNQRLLQPGEIISLGNFPFVLCHLDLFPRNLIWKDGEAPGVLDWSSAGFYPQCFEKCSHLVVGENTTSFSRDLFARLPELSSTEAKQMELILRVWRNMQRFSFTSARGIDDYSFFVQTANYEHLAPPSLPPYPRDWLDESELR